MFEEFFRKCDTRDTVKITPAQSENIRAALQKKLAANISQPKRSTEEKEKNIMKTKTIRTVIIAAAVAVAGLAGVAGATGNFLTKEEMGAELAAYNKVPTEFDEQAAELAARIKNETGIDDVFVSIPVYYGDMEEIGKLFVAEFHSGDYQGVFDENLPAIVLEHIYEDGGDVAYLIKPDGNGGYLYDGEPVTDEKLLAAIAEGTEKYGDTFVIQY